MRIAIIGGSGKMGRWFARFLLAEGHKVVITGRNRRKLEETGEQLRVEVASNEEAVRLADVVLLSVPIDNFESVVRQISPHTHAEQVIVDVTSIKEVPVEIMHRYIKRGQILGIHPMFGPGASSIASQNIVLTPTDETERSLAQKVKSYLETRGARVSLASPREHDEMMTIVLGLAHFIALVSADTLLGMDKLKSIGTFGGSTYRLLLLLVESVISEDPELYASLQMNIPGAAEVEKLYQRSAGIWADLVAAKDRQGFVDRMNELKAKLNQVDPDFGRGYEKVYKIVEAL
ncbi:prephenate dehydrogenase [Chloroflexota bacterium]